MFAPNLLAQADPEVWNAVHLEHRRQDDHVELIASENYVSPAVLIAHGTQLTNKYAEGYPGKRYYGGCEYVDMVETIALERAKQLFGAPWANVQPHSGSQANQAVYAAALRPGDTLLGMSLAHGGHLTHGSTVNYSGKLYKVISYGLSENEEIDYARPVLHRKALGLRVIDLLVLAEAIGDDLVELARVVDRRAVREVAAVRERHAEQRIARTQRRRVNRLVGLRARMRLHVRPRPAEQLLGALERNGLDHVDVLAAAVVALAGVALGVLVGELGTVRDQHGRADVVLGGDQLDVVVLPAVLEVDCVPAFRVGLREEVGGEHGSGAKAPMLLTLLSIAAKSKHVIAMHGGRLAEPEPST